MKDVFAEFDKDHNGDLELYEFVVLWHRYCQRNRVSNEIYVRRAFEFLDTDDMKAILLGEFTSVMTEIGEPLTRDELDKLFKMIDTNQEGMFYIDEFLKVNAQQAIADRVFQKAMGVAETSRQTDMTNNRPGPSEASHPNLFKLATRFMRKHCLKIFKG
ncbi:hypothetical protein BSKO_00294 [Bryopsis sp. KO-2023]|nr:hypothetical protein BSKO_00294 [Bryopsis sp. KO-2023]